MRAALARAQGALERRGSGNRNPDIQNHLTHLRSGEIVIAMTVRESI